MTETPSKSKLPYLFGALISSIFLIYPFFVIMLTGLFPITVRAFFLFASAYIFAIIILCVAAAILGKIHRAFPIAATALGTVGLLLTYCLLLIAG